MNIEIAAAATSPHGLPPPERVAEQFLRLTLAGDLYALRIDAVREILEVAQLTPVPLMPSFVRGVMNLRGVVVPVIDLAARLGLAETTVRRRTCIVIVEVMPADPEHGSVQTLGVLVDAVHEVFDIAADGHQPVPRLGTRIEPSFIHTMLRWQGRATPALALDVILAEATLASLIGAHDGVH